MEKFGNIEFTIGEMLEHYASKTPDQDALVYPFLNLRLTYAELSAESDKLAKGLMALGIKKGDHISVWAHNIPEWVLLLFASAKIGAVLVTVNTLYRRKEVEYLLHQSDTKALFLVEGHKMIDYAGAIYEIAPELNDDKEELSSELLPMLKQVVFIGEEKKPGMKNFSSLYEMGESISDEELESAKKSLDFHDVINMQYTSGTTGFPKGVMLSHYNIVNNGDAIGKNMKLGADDRLCIPVPFFHCFGLVLGIMACLTQGATMVPVESFNPVEVLKTIESEKCTGVHGVPTMFISKLQVLQRHKYDISHLRTGIMAGSTCPVEVMKQVIEEMNMTDITIVYGQTEASPGMTQTKIEDPIDKRVETVGKEFPEVEIKIVDPETGEDCPENVQGEIWGRGYNVMVGYYNMPEATKSAITEDGWLKTGDLAVKTSDGYYQITGRIKDMIIRGGENIYPREIEEFLYQHPDIEDIQVVGAPDKKYGEEVMAFVRLKEGSTGLTLQSIRDFCKGSLADYKIPKYVEIVSEYPMTASGKIQKYKLRELAAKSIS